MTTPSDYLWLDKKLREDFDALPFAWQYNDAIKVIQRAERFGRTDIANEMKRDLGIPTRQQVTGLPAISERAEMKMQNINS